MIRERRDLLRTLAVLVGGSLLSVVGAEVAHNLPNYWLRAMIFAVAAALLILWGFGAISQFTAFVRQSIRDNRLRSPVIGILTGLDGGEAGEIQGVWTDVPPDQWVEEIRKASSSRQSKVRTRLISAGCINDSYTAIVNPFGGTYPESSFDGYPVYERLLKYIARGGIFVNVADLPTYFAHNPRLGRSIDRTPAIYTTSGQPVRPFCRVPLLEEIAVETMNCESVTPTQMTFPLDSRFTTCGPLQNSVILTRVARVPAHENFQPILGPLPLNGENVSPMWICKYGNGRILASLSFLSGKCASNRTLMPLLANVLVQETAGTK